MEHCIITSYTGSGVAWLLNFFTELNILVYRGNSIHDTWNYDSINNKYTLKSNQNVLKQWMPVLMEHDSFSFENNIALKWTHDFPSINNITQKTILLIRDGRDTIYSQYKREKQNEKFIDMLYNRLPPLDLFPADTWAMHNYLWSHAIPSKQLFIIRFEDIKINPKPFITKLLNFLGIDRNETDILKAIESSSFERAKKAEHDYRMNNTQTQFDLVNRKGKPGEWKEVYTNYEIEAFNGFPSRILAQYQYFTDYGQQEDAKEKKIGHLLQVNPEVLSEKEINKKMKIIDKNNNLENGIILIQQIWLKRMGILLNDLEKETSQKIISIYTQALNELAQTAHINSLMVKYACEQGYHGAGILMMESLIKKMILLDSTQQRLCLESINNLIVKKTMFSEIKSYITKTLSRILRIKNFLIQLLKI